MSLYFQFMQLKQLKQLKRVLTDDFNKAFISQKHRQIIVRNENCYVLICSSVRASRPSW